MGFKRTAEGRVFFETPYESDESGGKGDLQIAGLLRALNERLKDAQAERTRLLRELSEFREIIEDLGERTERSENAYIDLEQKLAIKQGESHKKAERAERAAKETLSDILDARNSLSELLDKSEDGEKLVSAVRAQLTENKSLIGEMKKRQAILEKLQKEQGEKMVSHVAAYVSMSKRINTAEARYVALDNKIEETNAKQIQLDRKFEKSKEDRMRLLRKIDRIEETVIQMRDTLNAKAMVVLADPNAATGSAARKQLRSEYEEPVVAREPVVLKQKDEGAAASWWDKSFRIPASAVTVITAVLVMSGLILLMELTAPQMGGISGRIAGALDNNKWFPVGGGNAVVQSELVQPEPLVMDVQEELRTRRQSEELARYRQEQAEAAARVRAQAEAEAAAAAPQAIPVQNSEPDPTDDIGAVDLNNEEQLLAALEENPDALAAQLNAIEPGAETEAPEETQLAAVDAKEPAQPAPAKKETPPATSAPAKLTGDDNGKVKTTLAERIKPDTALPPRVKEIEIQAFAGVPEAQHDLAAIYTAGHGGVEPNYERAAGWFHEAADNGVANAQYNLGVLYHQGMGVPRSLEEAITWYSSAAKQGHPEAQYNLGIAYIEGIGVSYDPFKASGYFENAAKAGITEAAYNLGLIHENGLLGEARPDEALMWYKTAADKGSPEAKAALEQLAKTLNIDINEVNALADSVKESRAAPQVPAATAAPKPLASSVVVRQPAPAPAPVPAPAATTASQSAYVLSAPEQEKLLMSQVQGHLMRLGLYPGPADGATGPLTIDAIRSYQTLSGLEVTGKPSRQLLDHMAAQAETGSRFE